MFKKYLSGGCACLGRRLGFVRLIVRVSLALVSVLLSVSVSVAQAALHLELTQGVDHAIPIAVQSFQGERGVTVPGNTTLSAVIRHDLSFSGHFLVLPNLKTTTNHLSARQVNPVSSSSPTVLTNQVLQWRRQGADNVVVGSVRSLGRDQYQVQVQLINAYDEHGAALLTSSFTSRAADLRALAHHISDLIYQKLTGVRGIFSTKLAYILVEPTEVRTQPEISGSDPVTKTTQGPTTLQATEFNPASVRYQLMVCDVDGFNPRPLLMSYLPIMSPVWTPEGHHIAYVSFEGARAAIYEQDIDTGKRHLVTRFPGINGAPAFSPDGTQLAVVLTLSGSPNLYLYDVKTKKLQQLTRDTAIDTEPSWSPDGRELLFTSDRDGSPQVYRYELATGRVVRLTYEGNYNASAHYLPNGQGIVLMHRQLGLFGIAKLSLGNDNLQDLSRSGWDESPSVAPNGDLVIYATRRAGQGVLALVSIDGQVHVRLPAQHGTVQDPAWSPYF